MTTTELTRLRSSTCAAGSRTAPGGWAGCGGQQTAPGRPGGRRKKDKEGDSLVGHNQIWTEVSRWSNYCVLWVSGVSQDIILWTLNNSLSWKQLLIYIRLRGEWGGIRGLLPLSSGPLLQ